MHIGSVTATVVTGCQLINSQGITNKHVNGQLTLSSHNDNSKNNNNKAHLVRCFGHLAWVLFPLCYIFTSIFTRDETRKLRECAFD